ncbi:hypothetical protein H9P43_003047 [Blastocladiella emersonii ATCC 22665]|nr:hypothetical protein H9P43_003047 [Blastocladiella emersonii ATCC 22665]
MQFHHHQLATVHPITPVVQLPPPVVVQVVRPGAAPYLAHFIPLGNVFPAPLPPPSQPALRVERVDMPMTPCSVPVFYLPAPAPATPALVVHQLASPPTSPFDGAAEQISRKPVGRKPKRAAAAARKLCAAGISINRTMGPSRGATRPLRIPTTMQQLPVASTRMARNSNRGSLTLARRRAFKRCGVAKKKIW